LLIPRIISAAPLIYIVTIPGLSGCSRATAEYFFVEQKGKTALIFPNFL
jgi:hypothetical protein